jgi:hypothetical protein
MQPENMQIPNNIAGIASVKVSGQLHALTDDDVVTRAILKKMVNGKIPAVHATKYIMFIMFNDFYVCAFLTQWVTVLDCILLAERHLVFREVNRNATWTMHLYTETFPPDQRTFLKIDRSLRETALFQPQSHVVRDNTTEPVSIIFTVTCNTKPTETSFQTIFSQMKDVSPTWTF